MKNTVARAKLDLEQKRLGRDQRLESVQLQLARAEVALESANRELDLLEEDRPLLTQFAQLTGILFYGCRSRPVERQRKRRRTVGFQWQSAERTNADDRSGNRQTLRSCQVPRTLAVVNQPGSTAFLELTASGGRRVEVECEELNQVPVEPGQYRANFRFVRQADATDLLPLLTGNYMASSMKRKTLY